MKLTFGTTIDKAPKGYVRVRLLEEGREVRRFVREEGIEWIEIGAGKAKDMNQRRFITLCRSIVRFAKQHKIKKLALQFDLTPSLFKNLQGIPPEDISSLAAQNFVMANFDYTVYKSKPKDSGVEDLLLCGKSNKSLQDAVRKGQLIGEEVNACRLLANTPGGDMTPVVLAKATKDAAKGLPVAVKTLSKAQIKKEKMGLLLGVAEGSSLPPTFTIMDYKGGKGDPIVLIGKGVTFDSGGLNLKSETGIYEMHMDMSGAAAVIHTVTLAARLKLKKRVIGLIPAVENMPGNNAYRPGDVLRSMSGKTVEVLNTDAEGRLILADAITYAKRFKPSVVLDAATLTGAAMVALGLHASGLMTRDDKLADALLQTGEAVGDYVWRLPLWDEYEESLKSTFADIANVPGNGASSRYGGATNGGIFLWQFAKELTCPWAHVDIAPRMTAAPSEELAKGAAGAPIRLFISFIESWKS